MSENNSAKKGCGNFLTGLILAAALGAGIFTVGKEFRKLLALIRTESAQHPIHRVVVGVGAALRMTDSHAHSGILWRSQGTIN